MSELQVVRNGVPISQSRYLAEQQSYKKALAPKTGNVYGDWAGRDLFQSQLPGGQVIQFDLSKLTLRDFRQMRDYYQINASLSLVSFILHQMDWHIECEDKKIKDFITETMRERWTRLIRALSQAYWAGYSPVVLEFENDIQNQKTVITKYKDLIPEDCTVNWKIVEGFSTNNIKPKFKEYDGIKQFGIKDPIPPENTLWYPLLMENGDYYGRKLLKPAFPAWFFSILIHLYANRYFERFGEPVPVGRVDFTQQFTVSGTDVSARDLMLNALQNLRSRGVVILPSERDPVTKEYDFDIEYLESQMRGADFERYLARLDEEMSLSIFTPKLLFQTGESGSYNLGVQHMTMFLWMLNNLAADMKDYIDKYVVQRLHDMNFGVNKPKAQWNFRLMGKESPETIRSIVTEVIRGGRAMPDLEQLGVAVGLDLEEIQMLTADPNAPAGEPGAPGADNRNREDRTDRTRDKPKGPGSPRDTEKNPR